MVRRYLRAREVSNLINLYALVSRMRVLSSPGIVDEADKVVRKIVDTYMAPNRAFSDVKEVIDQEAMNPLRGFSTACRDELRVHGLHAGAWR